MGFLLLWRWVKGRSREAGLVAGPLGKIAWTLGVEPIPVDGPGTADWLGIVMDDRRIGDTEAESGDGGEGFAGGTGHGASEFG